ncbi:uncharacterized protein LOC123532233 [Mercenaria mercenaria]|uniref:uncharacterized protein LOC123532233 n=1 Tax=Mercenaria mercenaria TaxID=6596 RepID=UPI00234E5E60|nr:uncharacterized protein LOC123532233 [Mercenaria mercenaria]
MPDTELHSSYMLFCKLKLNWIHTSCSCFICISDSSRQPDLAFSKSTAVTGKSLQKRAISGTEEFIYKMEEKKVAELQLINKTLSSIDSSLKELVAIKKKKFETEIESNFLHQFEF